MYSSALRRLLVLAAAICLTGGGEGASGGGLPLFQPRAIQRLSARLRAPAPPVSTPLASGGVFQPYGQAGSRHSAWFGQSMGVPTYNWGYFGAKARPYTATRESYHGDHVEWTFRRGY